MTEFEKRCFSGHRSPYKAVHSALTPAEPSLPAGAIATNFDTARPPVSKQLQILTECELVQGRQQGREMHYQLNPLKMKEIADFIEPFRNMWEDRFSKLEQLMKPSTNSITL